MNLLLRLFLFLPGPGLSVRSSGLPSRNELPPLRPPHGQLPPSFWEQHGWMVGAADVLLLALLVLLILWARNSLRAPAVPPDEIARRDLEALRNQAEDGVLLMKVSGILRRFVAFACGLPPGELTTAELCQVVAAKPLFDSGLGDAIAGFLRQCDERKFAPNPPGSSPGAVDTALSLVEKIEQRRRQMAEETPASTSPSLPPPIPKSAAMD